MRRAVLADPKRAAEAFSRALRAGSSVEAALDRVLPPVSEAYLDVIRDQTTDRHTDNALKVWDQLASLRPSISLTDSFPIVGALMAGKSIAEASRAWDQSVLFAGLSHLQTPPASVFSVAVFQTTINHPRSFLLTP